MCQVRQESGICAPFPFVRPRTGSAPEQVAILLPLATLLWFFREAAKDEDIIVIIGLCCELYVKNHETNHYKQKVDEWLAITAYHSSTFLTFLKVAS